MEAQRKLLAKKMFKSPSAKFSALLTGHNAKHGSTMEHGLYSCLLLQFISFSAVSWSLLRFHLDLKVVFFEPFTFTSHLLGKYTVNLNWHRF